MPERSEANDSAMIAELFDDALRGVRALIAVNPRTVDPLDDEYIAGSLSGAPEAAIGAFTQLAATEAELEALRADIYRKAATMSRRAQNLRRFIGSVQLITGQISNLAKLALVL